MPTSTKSYSEHLQRVKACRSRWQLLQLRDNTIKSPSGTETKFRIVPIVCQSLSCPYCRKRKFNEIRQKLNKKGINRNWFMFTLSGIHTPNQEDEDLKSLEIHFRKLIQKLQRLEKGLEYFVVKELSPSGNWHLHGFWNRWIEWETLVKDWKRISGSQSVYLKRIKNGKGAVNYIYKYLLKSKNFDDEARMLYENSMRKFTTSRHFFQKETAQKLYESTWTFGYSFQELRSVIKSLVENEGATKKDFSFKDFPYESEWMENFIPETTESPPVSNDDWNPIELIF